MVGRARQGGLGRWVQAIAEVALVAILTDNQGRVPADQDSLELFTASAPASSPSSWGTPTPGSSGRATGTCSRAEVEAVAAFDAYNFGRNEMLVQRLSSASAATS